MRNWCQKSAPKESSIRILVFRKICCWNPIWMRQPAKMIITWKGWIHLFRQMTLLIATRRGIYRHSHSICSIKLYMSNKFCIKAQLILKVKPEIKWWDIVSKTKRKIQIRQAEIIENSRWDSMRKIKLRQIRWRPCRENCLWNCWMCPA